MSKSSKSSKKGGKVNKGGEETQETGTFNFPDGSSYNGEYKEVNGVKQRHGKGTYTSALESYVGRWEADKQDGEGVYKFNSGAVYKGTFTQGAFHGKGKYSFSDGASYGGEWSMNKMHGQGVYIDSQKVEWAGQFFNGMYDSGKSFVSVRGGKTN
jgi:hypothetical protein